MMMMMIMMMMIIITIIVIIIIIAFKGAIRDFSFFTISSLRREPSQTRTLKWSGHNRVQIIIIIRRR